MSVKSSSPSDGGLSWFFGKASSGTEGKSGKVMSGDIFERGNGFGCSLVWKINYYYIMFTLVNKYEIDSCQV